MSKVDARCARDYNFFTYGFYYFLLRVLAVFIKEGCREISSLKEGRCCIRLYLIITNLYILI